MQALPLKGDSMETRCVFDTAARSNATVGGLGIDEEMCVNYIHYYPKAKLEVCKSAIDLDALKTFFDALRRHKGQRTHPAKSVASNYLRGVHWDDPASSDYLRRLYAAAPLQMSCLAHDGQPLKVVGQGQRTHPAKSVASNYLRGVHWDDPASSDYLRRLYAAAPLQMSCLAHDGQPLKVVGQGQRTHPAKSVASNYLRGVHWDDPASSDYLRRLYAAAPLQMSCLAHDGQPLKVVGQGQRTHPAKSVASNYLRGVHWDDPASSDYLRRLYAAAPLQMSCLAHDGQPLKVVGQGQRTHPAKSVASNYLRGVHWDDPASSDYLRRLYAAAPLQMSCLAHDGQPLKGNWSNKDIPPVTRRLAEEPRECGADGGIDNPLLLFAKRHGMKRGKRGGMAGEAAEEEDEEAANEEIERGKRHDKRHGGGEMSMGCCG